MGTPINTEIQKGETDPYIELYDLDLTPFGDNVYHFIEASIEPSAVYWGGNTYTPFDVEATGFEWSGQGPIPTPKLKMSSASSLLTGYINAYGDLCGAKVTRTRTFRKFLDTGPTTSVPWTPASFVSPELTNWFKADTNVTTSGSNITTVAPVSPSATTGSYSQATSSRQPTLTASAVNGYPVMTFSGGSNLTGLAGSNLNLVNGDTNAVTLAVFAPSAATANGYVHFISTNTTNVNRFTMSLSAGKLTAAVRHSDGDSVTSVSHGTVIASGAYHVGMIQNNVNVLSVALDGGTPVTTTVANSNAFASTNSVNAFIGGDSATSSNCLPGAIAEVFTLYNATQADIDMATGYLAWKYNLQANLPAGHPYKSGSPQVITSGGNLYQTEYLKKDVYRINTKSIENKYGLEFELSSYLDQQDIQLPKGTITQYCRAIYRVYNSATGTFTYQTNNDLQCPYGIQSGTGSNYYDETNATTTAPLDKCNFQVSGCKIRFGATSELPFMGFPGVNRPTVG